MNSRKATHGQLRRNNRQLLLRAVYTGLARSRADLAHESGLAKPTVSDLIGELIGEGYLAEMGLGQSTDEGGKRPRLLEFVPGARHVIGLSVSAKRVLGVLANLDGSVLVQHEKRLGDAQGQAIIDALCDVINGLIAQRIAPLLCIGVGVPGLVDGRAGIVRNAPHLGWHRIGLAAILSRAYSVPTYLANSTDLAAMAQFAFGETNDADSLATVLVNDGVGVGAVLDGALYHSGSELSHVRVAAAHGRLEPLEAFLGWSHVRQRAGDFQQPYIDALQLGDEFSYLHLRQAVSEGHPAALALQDELAVYLAQIFAWVIALLHPDHVSLAGTIADLGQPLLDLIHEKTAQLIDPNLIGGVSFSVVTAANQVAIGAVAHTLHHELGVI